VGCGGPGPCEGPSVGDSGSGSWRASEVGRFSQKKNVKLVGNQEGEGIVVELGFRGTIRNQTYD